jgi:hypothetical protein
MLKNAVPTNPAYGMDHFCPDTAGDNRKLTDPLDTRKAAEKTWGVKLAGENIFAYWVITRSTTRSKPGGS